MDVPASVIRVAAIAWGCWALVYALLAAAQAGLLFVLLLGEVALLKHILIRIGFLRGAIATGFAVLVVIIMAVSCVLFDPKHMLHWCCRHPADTLQSSGPALRTGQGEPRTWGMFDLD